MKLARVSLAALVAVLALALSACGGGGGGGDVPEDAIAVVDGTSIACKELDQLMDRAKTASKLQGQSFPRAGTPEYRNLQSQYVAFLVQREQFEHEASELGIEITDKDIDKAVQEFVKSRFDGKRKPFLAALKEQGYTEATFRDTIRTSVLGQKIFDAVTKDIKVKPTEVRDYYEQNQASYSTPESRDVRHILVAEKKGDAVDFERSKAEADRLYGLLQNGSDFAALAKQESADTVSARDGGKLTISRGQTVPEFDKTAFDLELGVVSKPVKTTFGYHLIEALSPVRKAKSTPFDKVRASIEATLLQERKTEFMTEWAEERWDEYDGKTSYAAGFEPPELPDETETEPEPATE
jgi:parvulin-like peptidyl-prolyl isomerase